MTAFGHWLAGFIDGEGCFQITFTQDRTYTATFCLNLRADDVAILREIVERVGIGRVYRTGGGDMVTWSVATKADAARLVALLDEHPLRAKKARDFEVWRRAVLAWQGARPGAPGRRPNEALWAEMAGLQAELREGRRFAEAMS